MLELKNVSFHYTNGNTIFEDVNVEIQKGSITGFIGKNGVGKSTFFKLVLGLIKPTNGAIYLFDEDVSQNTDKHLFHKIGGIIENPAAYSFLTGYENLQYFYQFYAQSDETKIDEVVELFGLQDYIHQKYNTYSIGTKQKFGLCLAFLHKPELILLDEPTNGVDPWAVLEIKKIIKTLNATYHTTFIISSHIISDLLDISDSLLTFKEKKLTLVAKSGNFSSKTFHIQIENPNRIDMRFSQLNLNVHLEAENTIVLNAESDMDLNNLLKLLIEHHIRIKEVKPLIEL